MTFSDVTLCLNPVDASWLAANLQREIRELDRSEIASATPLTVEGKRQLQIGDRVVVRDDSGTDAVFDVKVGPWQLGHGAWVIGLKGISGGYALDRVTGIVSTVYSRGQAAEIATTG